MNNNLAAERTDIYELFREAAEEIEVEVDAEEIWLFEDDETAVDNAVDDITETYKLGVLATNYHDIRIIAAIAFCDTAEFKVYDYVGAGGEKYEDD